MSARAHSVSSPPRRPRILALARPANRLVLLLAGTRWLPLYGVIVHRGRRSGTEFRTPVVVRPTSDGFIVPMPWGETTDWYRNVQVAGECVVRWKGRDYAMHQPALVDSETAQAAFSGVQRAGIRRLGIGHFLRLQFRSPAAA